MTVLPIINPSSSNEWVQLIGKYMLNMGSVEAISRIIIANLNETDEVKIYRADLAARITYLRPRYPNTNRQKHKEAMKFFNVLFKHIKFRNTVAHSGVHYVKNFNGETVIDGLLNYEPDNKNNIAEFISIEEMRKRVDECASLGSIFLKLQNDFTLDKCDYKKDN